MENSIQLTTQYIQGNYLHLSLISPDYVKRTPLNVCFVIDVSSRFLDEIFTLDPQFQFQFEHVLGNAIQPLLHPLSQNDKVSIIQTSTIQGISDEQVQDSVSAFSPTHMNEEGKKAAISYIQNIKLSSKYNSTIDGIEKALGFLSDQTFNSSCTSFPVIILISDIKLQKTMEVSVSESYISRIKEYIAKNKLLENISINTCGVSQNVDSLLLFELSKEFNGQFAYLENFSTPEKVLSKVFSNIICTFSTNVLLNVSLIKEGLIFASSNPVSTLLPNKVNSDSTQLLISVGPVQYNQTREVIIRLNQQLDTNTNPSEVIAKIKITYDVLEAERNSFVKKSQTHEVIFSQMLFQKTSIEVLRLNFVDFMFSNIKKYQNGIQSFAVSALTTLLKNLEKNTSLSPYIEELFNIAKLHLDTTFSNENIFKKNKGSLLTLVRSHLLQLQSISHISLDIYSDKLFTHYVRVIEEAHSQIPSPKPSPQKRQKRLSLQNTIKIQTFDMYDIYEGTHI